jgi:pimeloyl-ACP methyl ester carboxylesterase
VRVNEVELSAGVIEYEDRGEGPVLVLLGGLLMDATLWEDVIAELAPGYRCIAPVLPLGGHRRGMREDADLSLPGIARLVEELLEALGVDDVTLVGNDTGGALVQLIAAGDAPRVGRIALVSCDAFDNVPPGLTGRALVLSGRLPPALFGLFMRQLRLRPLRRLPLAFGWLTKRGDAVTARWVQPRPAPVRRDTVRVLRAIRSDLLRDLDLTRFDRPALIVWASEDRVMPPEHGRRLAELLPQGRLVEIADSYTLIPLDQPEALAAAIRELAGRADRLAA